MSVSDSLADSTRVSSAPGVSNNHSEDGGGLTGLESTELDPNRGQEKKEKMNDKCRNGRAKEKNQHG